MSEFFFNQRASSSQELDPQPQPTVEQIDNLLADNNLMRKRLPEEKGSLLKSISDCLYFTIQFHEDIEQDLIKHLKNLIATNKLPAKLSMFKGNSILLKDFTMNPQLPGFEKINLELVASLYKVRVIVYGTTEDGYLSSMIVNHKFHKTIELLRSKNNHYDPVYSIEHINRAGVCQNIILNIVEQALHGEKKEFQDLNKDTYINFEYKNWMISKQEKNNLDQFRITRGRHKKSFSDNFAKNFEQMEDQMKIYNMFMNMKPPEDFLEKINIRKDTEESTHSINANLDFVNEGWQDNSPTNQKFALKNYPISQNNGFRRNNRVPSPQPQRTRQINQNDIYFRENLTLPEIERLEKLPLKESSAISPVFFVNDEPPGLTPTRYLQKPFSSFTDLGQPTGSNPLESHSPTFKNRKNLPPMQTMPIDYSHNIPDNMPQNTYPLGYQGLNNQSQVYNHHYLQRADSERSLQMPMGGQQFGINNPSMMPYNQQQQQQQQIPNNFVAAGKKKNFMMEDNGQRYMGRLKFFDETKNYGFIIMNDDGSDIFVHYDDLIKAGLTKDLLRTAKSGNIINVSFSCMLYVGKYNKSRKAVDIQLLL